MRPRDDAPEICYTQPWKCDPRYFECPLVVQTGNGPWHFTTLNDGVRFDLNGDGTRERTAWTAADSSLAFVALDRNGNGSIDDGRELFGEQNGDANGFAALAQHDDNGDGVIDARDTVWTRLVLWRDGNQNGRSETAELQPVSATLLALHTRHHPLNRRDPNGNILRFQSLLQYAAGNTQPYDDVYLRID
ncbi:MAG TPA: hypothetical protein VGF48_25025 [Thermoanaerobaculia bacterium]|jgi:hypothetical protein